MNTEIQQLEASIKTQQMLLKEMKKSQRKAVKNSRFTRWYLKTVQGVCKPFISIHDKANRKLKDPVQFRGEQLCDRGFSLYLEASDEFKPGDKNATEMAVRCAKQVCEIEEYMATNDLSKHLDTTVARMEKICLDLDGQVQRLRPKQKEEALNKIKTIVNEMAEQVSHA